MRSPIPFKYRLFKKYKGCPKQPVDRRDVCLGDIPYTPDPDAPSWEQGFDNEKKYGKLKREHQGSSLSCVSQAWSKYLEMLNKIEEGDFTDLSARDIYSQIYLPNGGAFIRQGGKVAVNKGNCKEALMPSYENGKPPTEQFMRNRDDASEITEQDALIVKAKEKRFVALSEVLTPDDWEHIRQVIWQFGGFVSGYKRHCMYASAYGMKNGKKFIKFVNSYGEGSDRYYFEDDGYPIYDITFLIDLPNTWSQMKIIGDKRDKRQYLCGADKVLHWIFGQPNQDSVFLQELHDAGIINKGEVEWKDNLDGYKIGSPWASLN